MKRMTYRTIHLKVYTSDMESFQKFTLTPPPGKLWPRENILLPVSEFVWGLKDAFPGNEFTVTKTKPNCFNVFPCPLHTSEPATA